MTWTRNYHEPSNRKSELACFIFRGPEWMWIYRRETVEMFQLDGSYPDDHSQATVISVDLLRVNCYLELLDFELVLHWISNALGLVTLFGGTVFSRSMLLFSVRVCFMMFSSSFSRYFTSSHKSDAITRVTNKAQKHKFTAWKKNFPNWNAWRILEERRHLGKIERQVATHDFRTGKASSATISDGKSWRLHK